MQGHLMPDACVVGAGPGLGLPPPPPVSAQYGDYVTAVSSHQDGLTYGSHHPPATDFPSAAMYVNSVWGPEQPPPPQTGVYYEPYSPYGGYPGHMLPGGGGQDLPPGYPGMAHHDMHDMHEDGMDMSASGKRKRRRVITYEQRKAANVRERKRMCHLNDAFDVLRKRVPTFAYEKKLSRIETLKLAVTYIQYMAELLEDMDDGTGASATKTKKSRKGKKNKADNIVMKENASPIMEMTGNGESEEEGQLDVSGGDTGYSSSQGEQPDQTVVDVVMQEAREMCSSHGLAGSPGCEEEEEAAAREEEEEEVEERSSSSPVSLDQ